MTSTPVHPVDRSGSRPHARRLRGGFSLLETAIALSILGLGLIMVAAIFPVALSQHRDSVYQARATALASKAEAMLRSRLDPNQLWVSQFLPSDADSPWYLLPTVNLALGAARWDAMPTGAPPTYGEPFATNYAYVINGATETDVALNPALQFNPPLPGPGSILTAFRLGYPHGLDILSDRSAPYSAGDPFSPFGDHDLSNAPNRLVWFGFYRRMANGTVHYAVAVCRQQRNQLFAEQNVLFPGFQTLPTASPPSIARGRRLPVPWRVTVGYDGARLYSNVAAPEGLGELAPIGAKIMIHGQGYDTNLLSTDLPLPVGRILTVSDVINTRAVEVLEDLSDLPLDTRGFFDVWIVPPPVVGGDASGAAFGSESPLIDWKVFP